MKFIYLYLITFAFIITSCYEQTALDDVENDNQSDLSYGSADDIVDNDNQSDSQDSNTDNNQSDPSYDDKLNNNDNNVKTRNKSGSRIIFNEYHLSDGSVIYDNKPFDSSYDRYCTFVDDSNPMYLSSYSGLEGCCVSFHYISSMITAYKNSNCTDEVLLVKINSFLSTPIFNSDIALWQKDNPIDSKYFMCGDYYTNVYIQIEPLIDHEVYIKTPDPTHRCLTWEEYAEEFNQECYYLASYKELTIEEARAFFVCAE